METVDSWHEYYLIRYVHNPDRGETVNVGVVVNTGDEFLYRFLACDGDKVRPGRLPRKILRSNYANWVAYFVRKMADREWSAAVDYSKKRPTVNYFAEFAGTFVKGHYSVDQLFEDLVA